MCFSHCGRQSTVVHSRVRHTHILDCQRNWFWRCVDMCIKSVFELFIFISSLTNSLEHIFRNSVYFLLIPKESWSVRSLICAVDYYSSTFISSLNSCFLLNTVLWFYSCRTKSWTASAKKYHKHLNISIACWKNYSQKILLTPDIYENNESLFYPVCHFSCFKNRVSSKSRYYSHSWSRLW